MRIQLTKWEDCSGCRVCEVTCSKMHFQEFNPKRSRIRIASREPGIDYPIVCRQCKNPICKTKCPFNAIEFNEYNIPVVNETICTGCGICVEECPFGGITIDPVSGTAIKCNLCDGDPQCVARCPGKALSLIAEREVAQEKRYSIVDKTANKLLNRYNVTLYDPKDGRGQA